MAKKREHTGIVLHYTSAWSRHVSERVDHGVHAGVTSGPRTDGTWAVYVGAWGTKAQAVVHGRWGWQTTLSTQGTQRSQAVVAVLGSQGINTATRQRLARRMPPPLQLHTLIK